MGYKSPQQLLKSAKVFAPAGRLFTKKWKFLPFWGRIPTPWTDWCEISHS